ncbi:uncharacterized protein LOC143907286 [Temnothorax americanus]|uniref:uncharacterized protein LOC143907286 n=1 Tax=Temnothorax americanus TaxID=1964332 RepID=UPI00406896FB
MVTTIEQALRPLFLICHILGLSVHISGKLYLSIFYSVILWSVYSYLSYYVMIALKVEKIFLATSIVINDGFNYLIVIISIIMSLYQHKKLQMFIKKLAAVDDTLEELGTPKIYQKLHVYIKKVLIGWLVCSQLININDMIWWFHTMKSYWCMIIPHITNNFRHTNVFVDLIFTIYLWYIGTRFDKLNEHMRCLLLKEKYSVRCTWRKAVRPIRRYIMCINNYKSVLWTTMHLHLELCQLARKLNAMFEIQMTMEMAAYLIFLIRLFRYTFIHITTDKFISSLSSYLDWIDIYIWVSLYVARVFCLNYVCESVSAKSNEMNTIIHQLTDSLQYADIRDEIYQFTLQIIHHPLTFSGLGLFQFGNSCLRKRFTICLKKLAIVDDSLEELGTPKMYQKMHMWSKIVIIGWLMLSLFTNYYDSLWWLKESGNVYISYALNHSVHINTLVDLLFISILWYVGTRFDKVNEHMQYLLVREEHGLRCTWEKPVIVHRYILYTDNYKRTLWILMHVHLELCRLARELNMIFGIQMTLEMTSCFLYLITLCVWLCRMVMREYNNEEYKSIYSIYSYFRQSTWFLLFLLKLYTVNYMCENVSLKANQIDKIIHKLSSTLRYADVWKEICQFTLQITYHRLKFTGMGLFYFGNSFLRKLGTTIVTFVIIMRQMKIT